MHAISVFRSARAKGECMSGFPFRVNVAARSGSRQIAQIWPSQHFSLESPQVTRCAGKDLTADSAVMSRW
jgi:hypothetical protein